MNGETGLFTIFSMRNRFVRTLESSEKDSSSSGRIARLSVSFSLSGQSWRKREEERAACRHLYTPARPRSPAALPWSTDRQRQTGRCMLEESKLHFFSSSWGLGCSLPLPGFVLSATLERKFFPLLQACMGPLSLSATTKTERLETVKD